MYSSPPRVCTVLISLKKVKANLLSRVWLFATPWTVPARLLHPWDSPGKNSEVGCHVLLQRIFPTQWSNLGLLHCRQTFYRLSHQGSFNHKLNKQDDIHSLDRLFSQFGNSKHASISGSNCGFLTCIQVLQEAGRVVWYSYLFKNFPWFVVTHTVKGFPIANEAEIDVLLEFSCFFPDPIRSDQISCSVVSDSLQPHESQHARPPCPSPSPRVHSDSCPWSQWCHPTISSSVVPFSSCLQTFPAWASFPMSWPFTSGGQSIGVSASASVLPLNIQGWFPLGLTGLISLLSEGISRIFSNTTVWKNPFFGAQHSLWSNSYIHIWLLEKPKL